jgi:hypothetical protein
MSHIRKHSKQAIKQRGEVFTPTPLVNEMLGKIPPELFTNPEKTFLDNSCGNGQFLSAVLEIKMKNGISHNQALSTIYGVELDDTNAKECRERLSLGSKDPDILKILENNIVCADALDPNHPGWSKVGFYWDREGLPKTVMDIMAHWNEQIENGDVF